MKKNYLQIIFLGALCLILIIVPGYRIALGDKYDESSLIEQRRLATFPALSFKNIKLAVKRVLQGKTKDAGKLFFNQFIDRSFQTQFEDAAADQFPFRIPAIQIAKMFERGMINLAYLFLSDSAIPADATSGLYVMRDSSRIIHGVNSFTPSSKESIDKRISNYAELIRLYPNQKFYLFFNQRLYDSPYHPLINYFNNSDAGQSFQYFKENKPEGLILSSLLLSGMDDHINYFYSTDHHWNIRGACRAYGEIYKMLAAGYPTISPALKCDEFITVPNVTFLGSLARQTLYPLQAEKFEISKVKLPSYRVITNGKVTYHAAGSQDVTIKHGRDPYTNLYITFFGPNVPLEEYVFDNGSHRNAIIIGDSYVNPIEPYLAYHYSHTYFVDFRGYDHFSLGDLLKKYQIDDIIIIGNYIVGIASESWFINP
jgi:hypothetical protein